MQSAQGTVAVLGGSGFVGRHLVERWPATAAPLRLLIHRSTPGWLAKAKADTCAVDLAQVSTVQSALEGATCVINLLRPDGNGWLLDAMGQIVPALSQTSVRRLIHASSIDVYGLSPAMLLTEDSELRPQTPYQREHAQLEAVVEQADIRTCVVRPGAVFGLGGRNVATLVPEVKEGPTWRLAARRSLYGHRRMHLVSVENVADAFRTLIAANDGDLPRRVLVTDDAAPGNNFAHVQDSLTTAFGRPRLDWVPEVPGMLLQAAMAARGRPAVNPMRRFSDAVLTALGFHPEQSFPDRLSRYVASLRAG